jgi:hypothetical protein
MGIIKEEGLTPDDLLLRYVSLFKGPLINMAVKALAALCSLNNAPMTSAK